MVKHIRSDLEKILGYILAFFGEKSIEMKGHALACLKGWIEFGIPMEVTFSSNGVIEAVISCIRERPLFVEACALLEHAFAIPLKDSFNNHVVMTMKRIMELSSIYEMSMQKHDDDVCRAYVSLVASLGMNQVHVFAMDNQITNKYLELIIYCTKHPDVRVIQLTLEFWYHLQVEVMKFKAIDKFKPVFMAVVPLLIRSLDKKLYTSYGEDDISDFRLFIGDTLAGPYQIIWDDYFVICKDLLNSSISKKQWNLVEATLYGIASVASYTSQEGLVKLNPILLSLPNLGDNDEIRSSVIFVIGSYSKYIVELDPKYTIWCLNYSLSGVFSLKDLTVALDASKEFVEFCENIKEKSVSHEVIGDLINGCLRNLEKLSTECGSNVLNGLSFILAAQKDDNFQTQCLQSIYGYLAKRIQALSTFTKQNIPILLNHLVLFKSAMNGFDGENPQHVLTQVLIQIYTVLTTVAKNYKDCEPVISQLAKTLSFIAPSIGSRKETYEFLHKILGLGMMFYEHYQYPAILDLIMTSLGKDTCLNNDQFKMIVVWTFQSRDLSSNQELLERFFKFLIKSIELDPSCLKSDLTEKFFELGVSCIDFQGSSDFELSLTVVKFFKLILTVKIFDQQSYTKMVWSFAPQLIEQCLNGILEQDSKNANSLFQMLEALIKFPQVYKSVYLNFAMNPKYPRSFNLTETEKTAFVKSVLSCHGLNGIKKEFDHIKRTFLKLSNQK